MVFLCVEIIINLAMVLMQNKIIDNLIKWLTSAANKRGLKPRAEQGPSSKTRSKLLGANPFEFTTLPPFELFLPGPFLICLILFLVSALLRYLPFSSNKSIKQEG